MIGDCTFCGHSEVPDRAQVRGWLNDVCERLIGDGAAEFYLGGYGAFDRLCADVLHGLKRRHAHIRLILVLPYLNGAMPAEGYDETVYPPLESVPRRYAILRRNEWMIQRCDVLVAYVTHGWGGAARTLAYALQKEKDHSRLRRMSHPLKEQQAARSPLCLLLFFACPHGAACRPNRRVRPEGKEACGAVVFKT